MHFVRTIVATVLISFIMQTAAHAQVDCAELEARMQALQLQVEQLKENRDQSRSSHANAIRNIVADVLHDADARHNLLSESMAAGWNDGFFLASADDNFEMHISGRMQVRYAFSEQRDGSLTVDEHRGGFDNRRTRFRFRGHVVDPRWSYDIHVDFSNSGGALALFTALIGYEIDEHWSVQIGKTKHPYLREALTSSAKLLAVDRTLVHQALKPGRSEGIQLTFQNQHIRWKVYVHDDFGGSGSTPALARDTEFAVASRLELLLDGMWSQFGDFSSWRNEPIGILVGAAASYNKAEYGTADADEESFFAWTIDAGLEYNGFNMFAAIVGQHSRFDTADDIDIFGAVVQAGYFVRDDIEIFARYEWGDDGVSDDDLSIATAGATWFISGDHTLKLTSDIGYAFEAVSDFWASSGAGWRTDADDSNGQLVFRTQLQLLF